jgi:translation initiation factor IF-2
VVCGLSYGKVRAMTNERGERLQKAGPATPVEITGLGTVPAAGDRLETVKDDKAARQIALERQEKARSTRLTAQSKTTLEDLYRRIKEGEQLEMNLVVKGDVQGSVEAVVGQLNQLDQSEVKLRILHTGVGNIGQDDVMLAAASNAVVIGFNVRADQQAQQAAEREHVQILSFNIIYELTDAVERAMKGRLAPVFEDVELGKAEVRATFRTPKGVVIAGCYVTDGKVVRNQNVRVVRAKEVIFTSKIDSLKHIKDDVREMAAGFECGIVIADFTDVQVGDVLECFETRQVERV